MSKDFENKHPRDKSGQFVDKHQSVKPNVELGAKNEDSVWYSLLPSTKEKLAQYGVIDVAWENMDSDWKHSEDFEVGFEHKPEGHVPLMDSTSEYVTATVTTKFTIGRTPVFITRDGQRYTFNDLTHDEITDVMMFENTYDMLQKFCEDSVDSEGIPYAYHELDCFDDGELVTVDDLVLDGDIMELFVQKKKEEQ